MAKYRKKPIVIEAFQVKFPTTLTCISLPEWLYQSDKVHIYCLENNSYIKISTFEGDMKAYENDWIIKGINGELYPCKADIFEKIYDRVEE